MPVPINDDEKRFVARIAELVQKAGQGISGVSDFLDLRQQELARTVAVNGRELGWRFDGGYEDAERRRFIAYPEWETDAPAGIACLRIDYHDKDSIIAHRDYLGAVLNLGIKREKLGDIVVQEASAFLFADEGLAGYISQQLQRVKHSRVSVEIIDLQEFIFQSPALQSLKASLASLRLDAALAAAFHLSRGDAEQLITSGNVRINHLEVYKCAAPVQSGDLVSVRGKGRFRLEKVGGISKKGRYQVEISRW